jgi:hypothetical protein
MAPTIIEGTAKEDNCVEKYAPNPIPRTSAPTPEVSMAKFIPYPIARDVPKSTDASFLFGERIETICQNTGFIVTINGALQPRFD